MLFFETYRNLHEKRICRFKKKLLLLVLFKIIFEVTSNKDMASHLWSDDLDAYFLPANYNMNRPIDP